MEIHDLLEELEKLAALKKNWYSVAEVFGELKERCAGQTYLNSQLIKGYEACGFSRNTLNRMLAVKSFFDSLKVEIKELNGIDANNLSFPSLEVVKRLHQVNPAEGIKLLREVAKGEIKYKDLRDHYKKVISGSMKKASSHQIARLEAIDFTNEAYDTIKHNLQKFFKNNAEIKLAKPRDKHFFADAIVYEKKEKENLQTAFKFRSISNPENFSKMFQNFISQIIFSAGFFHNYWVIFPTSLDVENINYLSKIFDLLHQQSIGIATITWGEEKEKENVENIKFYRTPNGPSSNDWQECFELYKDLCRKIY